MLYCVLVIPMNTFLEYIKTISDAIAYTYHVDVGIFFVVYFVSFIPFYLGYFLIIFGTTRKMSWKEIFSLKIGKNFQWDQNARIGLYIHLFGRVMPYVYILIWGRNLPSWVHILIIAITIFTVYVFFRKINLYKQNKFIQSIKIIKNDVVTDLQEVERLWLIYDTTFEPINKISPCKQSLDRTHFFEVLADSSVSKYVIHLDGIGSIGIGLVTNNFTNTPWISEDYFKVNFPSLYTDKLIYYFMGLAIDHEFRGNKYSIVLIERIIDDLPKDAVMGFDHSHNVNPMLHYFTRIVKQANLIERKHIDKQHYHVVQRKK